MTLAEIPFPQIDPEIFSVGALSIRWYGLSYVMGFLVAWWLITRLCREKTVPMAPEHVGDLIFATMIGVIVGGRLGYVFVYKPAQFLEAPLDVFKIWTGGMSFHGGCAGVMIAMFIFARRRRITFRSLWDACAIGVTPGIFLVRMANFINGELWGRPTDVPWAMVFPSPEAGGVPRHPSQIYEGLGEGLLLFAVLWSIRKRPFFRQPGRIGGAFLVGYGLVRFAIEFVRQPDAHLGTVLGPFSMGQLLCCLMIGVGIWLLRGPASPATPAPAVAAEPADV